MEESEPPTYRTFKRSARSFEEYSANPKEEVSTGLSWAEAEAECREFNSNRSETEIDSGTKMEFEAE